MKRNNRWMKWVLETSAEETTLPWTRNAARLERRKTFKAAIKARARAA